MSFRRVLPIAIASALAACGPAGDLALDAGSPIDHPTDAGRLDTRPILPSADAAGPEVLIYVQTRTTLYTIDPRTFTLTAVGDFANDDAITDIAVTPDGTLYGISRDKLYVVDRAIGKASLVGDVPGVSNVGLTFLPDGTLLATDKAGGVRSIQPADGQVREIGSFGGGFATAGDLVAVADGTMYAISDKGPVGDEADNNWLLTVNTATGRAAPVGQIGFGGVFGCAYANGHVYAFTSAGEAIEIDRDTGSGALVRTYPVELWGAGVTPLVPVIP